MAPSHHISPRATFSRLPSALSHWRPPALGLLGLGAPIEHHRESSFNLPRQAFWPILKYRRIVCCECVLKQNAAKTFLPWSHCGRAAKLLPSKVKQGIGTVGFLSPIER